MVLEEAIEGDDAGRAEGGGGGRAVDRRAGPRAPRRSLFRSPEHTCTFEVTAATAVKLG